MDTGNDPVPHVVNARPCRLPDSRSMPGFTGNWPRRTLIGAIASTHSLWHLALGEGAPSHAPMNAEKLLHKYRGIGCLQPAACSAQREARTLVAGRHLENPYTGPRANAPEFYQQECTKWLVHQSTARRAGEGALRLVCTPGGRSR
jgi:hypothetical protein